MYNFEYYVPTKILFGKGQIENLPNEVLKKGKRVLLTYGGGSVKKIGLYQRITELFDEHGIEYFELSGIEPNPKITSVREGVKICRENNVDAIVAIGGGSTIDCSKAISAGVNYDGDAWDLVEDWGKVNPETVLPLFSVLTLSATGSEMNGNAVISNMESNDKKALIHPCLKPVCSVLDPTYTYTVSKYQTASGTADIFSHIVEVYFSTVSGALVQNTIAEALLKTCIECGKKAVQNPDDYDARANLMWTSSLAINGLISCGTGNKWSCHSMEHQLSAYYDITHGAGLAVLTPAWFRYILSEKTVDKFVDFGVNVWGIDKNLEKFDIANKAIEMTKSFFDNDLGLPKNLSELGIGEDKLEIMAQKASEEGLENAYVALDSQDVFEIYKSCMM